MKEALQNMMPTIAGWGVYLAAGGALGLAVGLFGRTLLGIVAAGLLAAALVGLADPYISFVYNGVSSLPQDRVAMFLSTAAGLAAVAGFLVGLYIAARRAR